MNKPHLTPKVLVVHPGQQHSYRLAIALERKGLLYKYITTVYNKPLSLTHWLLFFLRGDARAKAANRCINNFPNHQVKLIGEVWGLLLLLVQRVRFLPTWVRSFVFEWNHIYFEWRVASYAIKHKVDAVIAYDTNASILFAILKKKAPHIKRILDVSAANRLYMKQIYEKDLILAPAFAKRIHQERLDRCCSPTSLSNRLKEIQLADYFLAPSHFVQKSLAYSGVKKSQILCCPYGVDSHAFLMKTYTHPISRPLRFIYVGGVKEIKGIAYLLQAFKQIPVSKATLTVVGAVNLQDADLQPYVSSIRFTGVVLHSQIPTLLQEADVFVFPSLGEGLSLSTLEAAACGLPLIVSENSGVNDLITPGKEGFIIPIQSVEAIVEKVNWFIAHPDKIEPMGRAARKLAEKYTWEAYYQRMGSLMTELFQ